MGNLFSPRKQKLTRCLDVRLLYDYILLPVRTIVKANMLRWLSLMMAEMLSHFASEQACTTLVVLVISLPIYRRGSVFNKM